MSESYPAPKNNENFKKYWDLFVPGITERENFQEVHLKILELFCDQWIHYERLEQFVNENGYSFVTSGRYGESRKVHEEVKLLQNVVMRIQTLAKDLDIKLAKDTFVNEDDDDDEWN